MYIEKLAMLNIRSYPLAQIEFSKGINIIAGRNNSGKSTILRALQNLQYGLTGLNKEDVRKGEGTGKIYVKISGIKHSDQQRFQPPDNSVRVESSQDIFFEFFADKKSSIHQALQVTGGQFVVNISQEDISVTDVDGASVSSHLMQFPSFPSMEDEENFIYPFLAKRRTNGYNSQGGRHSAFSIVDQLYNLPSRIQNLENSSHPFHKQYKAITEDILGFTPGKVPGSQGNEDKLGIFGRSRDTIYIDSMGDGVANILGLLTVLLTEDRKLFLIEELENDIHPEALKKLLTIIVEKSKYNQFIITTHSNIVLKYLASTPEAKIFYTDWELKEYGDSPKYYLPTSSIRQLENSPSERSIILQKLGYDMLDFDLYSSYIIFEESSAEQIVNEILIPAFVPCLKNRVKTIAAGGADDLFPRFNDFHRLFVFIHSTPVYKKKAWVIADGDEVGTRNINMLREKFDWPKSHFINFTKPNFEEYYPDRFRDEFEEIKREQDKRKRFELKKLLTSKVMTWIWQDPEKAKEELKESAKEVIEILVKIERQLSE